MGALMIKKNFPIKKPYFYDTRDGIDYFTKELLIDQNSKKLSEKEKQEIHKLGKDMKKAALNHHVNGVKQFDNLDPTTYPSNPKVRGQLLEIDKLEKDLATPKLTNLPILKDNINRSKPRSRTGNPSGRDYWKEFVKLNTGNEGERILPEVSPEDRNQLSGKKLWEQMYKNFTPFEKGTWNAEKRREKLQKEKEAEEDKKFEAEEKRKYGTFGLGYNSKKMAEEVVSDTLKNSLKKIEIPRVILPEETKQSELPFNPPLPEPETTVDETIKDLADKRLDREQRAWDQKFGRSGITSLQRPT